MNLFCDVCGELHRFTLGDVERIVYALQAENACEFVKGVNRTTDCLKDVLENASEPELYLEYVQELVEARQREAVIA